MPRQSPKNKGTSRNYTFEDWVRERKSMDPEKAESLEVHYQRMGEKKRKPDFVMSADPRYKDQKFGRKMDKKAGDFVFERKRKAGFPSAFQADSVDVENKVLKDKIRKRGA